MRNKQPKYFNPIYLLKIRIYRPYTSLKNRLCSLKKLDATQQMIPTIRTLSDNVLFVCLIGIISVITFSMTRPQTNKIIPEASNVFLISKLFFITSPPFPYINFITKTNNRILLIVFHGGIAHAHQDKAV